jgi:hypothetical protein
VKIYSREYPAASYLTSSLLRTQQRNKPIGPIPATTPTVAPKRASAPKHRPGANRGILEIFPDRKTLPDPFMHPIFPFSARNRLMGASPETAQRIVKILLRDEFDFNIALGGAPHGNQQALIDSEMS